MQYRESAPQANSDLANLALAATRPGCPITSTIATVEAAKITMEYSIRIARANDPSSATAPAARVGRTVRSQIPATLERTAQRPFAAAHG